MKSVWDLENQNKRQTFLKHFHQFPFKVVFTQQSTWCYAVYKMFNLSL